LRKEIIDMSTGDGYKMRRGGEIGKIMEGEGITSGG
jgi:hypothetical protein